jgi:redox-sensitive bicupin YhaK (pirin superfamily)
LLKQVDEDNVMAKPNTHVARQQPRAERREIEAIYQAPPLHWVGDGFRVSGYFSAIPDVARKLSPFLLLDYHPVYDYPPATRPRGVGVHPHRGFETVTFAWQGSVAHHDSTGAGGVIGPGDVQWMTAASGILHKEYHEESYSRRGGPFQMAQLWVNLPRAYKMAPPQYQPLAADQMGVVTLPNDSGIVRVVAGELHGVRGPANTFTPIDVFDAQLRSRGQLELAFPAHYNAALLVMSGEVTINGTRAKQEEFVVFKNVGERITLTADSDAHLLVLAGEPIDEPVVQYGPFVMNTAQEIRKAYADFQSGKFGTLED